ncbi:MAG: protein-glutamate O-methyltransferase CheR [Lachnospiraceae bacterium]|nr:protein-glutamate O-methyltransferase CheR [Lachnospiraceae bacterium]
MEENYEYFKTQILRLTSIDLNAYKEGQMRRRIDTLIQKHKCNYVTYVNLIKSDKAKFEEFVNFLTINVSEFWRNPEQWKVLEEKVLPDIIKIPSFKIWSAACSTGDEPYSLVMLLSRYLPLSRIKIIATDIDKQVLEKARVGLYHEKSLKGLPKEFITKYFEKKTETSYQISNDIKRCVEFKEHNLLKDPYPSMCDLIVCRNVLIYFTEEAKDEIYVKFNKALKPGGVLFLGSTEQIIQPGNIGFGAISSFFYQKKN